MVALTTQSAVRKVRNLPFCYICGLAFNQGDVTDYDHVPPETAFLAADRNYPIKLKTHKHACHEPINLDDEVMGQLIRLIDGQQSSGRDDKLKIKGYSTETGKTIAVFDGKNLEELIKRWLKGFHAALYRTALPKGSMFAIQTPFPSGVVENGELVVDPILEQHYKFVESIKRNRVVNNLDLIVSNNEKFKYECVWDQLNDKSWICIFAIDLYGWKDLGDINNFQPRGCAGSYRLPTGHAPAGASLATQLEFKLNNLDRADPFSV